MADGLQEALATLAASFTATIVPPNGVSQQFTASLTSSAITRGTLQIPDVETTMQLVDSAVNLSWLTKSVRFVDPDIANSTVLGGLPISDLLDVNVGNVTNGATSPPGVPGLLGLLSGTVQIPMDVTQTTLLDVSIDAQWTITDDQGNVVSDSDVSWTITNGGSTLQQGTSGEIAVLSGLALDALNLVFDVSFVEATSFDGTSFPAPIAKRSIAAAIQLRAGTASSGWIDLPPVTASLPVVPVPTILILFENASFTDPGCGFIMVPANSPLDQTTVVAALQALNATLAPLQSTLSILDFIVGALGSGGSILSALDAAKDANLVFLKADSISDLSTIAWRHHWYGDEDVEDNASALMLLGPPGRQAKCYNGRDLDGPAEGELDVTVGPELVVEIPNLHSANPPSTPAGRTSVPYPPTGWRRWHYIHIFGDEFSSLEFAWQT